MISVRTRMAAGRIGKAARGFLKAIPINAEMLGRRLSGRKNLVFHVGAATQLMHVEDVIKELASRMRRSRLSIRVFTKPGEMAAAATKARAMHPRISVHDDRASRFLLFCDLYSTVDQGEGYPLFGCRIRACSFHGQPSKGNVYQRFNYRQINTLFFYGPLMRDHYLDTRRSHPEWPPIGIHEVGQPLSDRHFNHRMNKTEARRRLGLASDRLTVLYAPSFEYCSSLASHGPAIIEALLSLGANLIVKPHPAFYNAAKFEDDFNRDIPTVHGWREAIGAYTRRGNCVFPLENILDSALVFAASDVMVTDYSGVAFDGILQNLGLVFWDCPKLFDEYLPRRYGIDSRKAREDLACNAGRDAGIVVRDERALAEAVGAYHRDPSHLEKERADIRDRLLFNPGRAAGAMADKIEELLVVRVYDRQREEYRVLGPDRVEHGSRTEGIRGDAHGGARVRGHL